MIKVEDLYKELSTEIDESKRSSPVAGSILAHSKKYSGIIKLSSLYSMYCGEVKPCHRNYFKEVMSGAFSVFEDDAGVFWVDMDSHGSK